MDILQKEPILQKYYEEFKVRVQINNTLYKRLNYAQDWEWRFGKTPEFEYNLERRFDWGIMVFISHLSLFPTELTCNFCYIGCLH